MLEDFKDLKTDKKTLRDFGLLVGGIFLALAALMFWKERSVWQLFTVLGTVLLVPGLLFPSLLKYPYLAWMSLALCMGFVMSRVIISIVFFLVLTPIAFFMRASKRVFLDMKFPEPEKKSYWIKREAVKDKERYTKQY